MFSDMSNLTLPPPPQPTKMCPTPTIDRYMSKLLRQASMSGFYPKLLIVEPEDYIIIIEEMNTLSTYPTTQDNQTGRIRICGVPAICVPFIDDPLYKKLQSYAAISGLEITYPGTSEEGKTLHTPMAEAFGDNYGWRFTWRPYTGIGDSTLEEVTHRWLAQGDFQFSGFQSLIPQSQLAFSNAGNPSSFAPSGGLQCSRSRSVTKPTL